MIAGENREKAQAIRGKRRSLLFEYIAEIAELRNCRIAEFKFRSSALRQFGNPSLDSSHVCNRSRASLETAVRVHARRVAAQARARSRGVRARLRQEVRRRRERLGM